MDRFERNYDCVCSFSEQGVHLTHPAAARTKRADDNHSTFTDPELRNCQVSFAIWHFLATFIVLYAVSLGPVPLFEPARIPIRGVLPVCVLFAAFLVLNNLSLTNNNVGFYQLAKIMTVPSVVFFNYVLFRRKVSRSKLLCVLAACLGVALANGVSAKSNPVGAVIAALSFCATALYQIWIGKTLQDLNVSAPQLLLNQTLVSCILLAVFIPFFDTVPNFSTSFLRLRLQPNLHLLILISHR